MKNLLKYYIAAFYLFSDFQVFAQPGVEDNGTGLESGETPAAPIDDYLWLLALACLIFAIAKFSTFASKQMHS